MRLHMLTQILLARLSKLSEIVEWNLYPVERALAMVKRRCEMICLPLAINAANHRNYEENDRKISQPRHQLHSLIYPNSAKDVIRFAWRS